MIGTIAAVLTTGAFIPQVLKTIKTKDTSGISLGMYSMQVTGIALWLVYGLSIGDMALIAANGCSFFFSLIILSYKLKEVMTSRRRMNCQKAAAQV
ncbi:SemiSWEET transporter [Ileibacterium valens]|uniref:Glutathione synthetase n=1 Tax=Ileibacterium valens TaxID=1862668 RepID=A0A1U7NFD2_9FIRM|nr:SemiSWEET transporter [Ileibacterium valens]OLU38904.1 hypothetical protein BO222_07585 [Ileibacterium valens]OLU40579.1 hypothetical protein BM735_05370 [Erysipelotrichaceae bacterium NYU-BL-F16]OLU41355.1 hypothetical protein BO224_03665 [Erysipelotrichaceae bacterium NYU-BL-E8]